MPPLARNEFKLPMKTAGDVLLVPCIFRNRITIFVKRGFTKNLIFFCWQKCLQMLAKMPSNLVFADA